MSEEGNSWPVLCLEAARLAGLANFQDEGSLLVRAATEGDVNAALVHLTPLQLMLEGACVALGLDGRKSWGRASSQSQTWHACNRAFEACKQAFDACLAADPVSADESSVCDIGSPSL